MTQQVKSCDAKPISVLNLWPHVVERRELTLFKLSSDCYMIRGMFTLTNFH